MLADLHVHTKYSFDSMLEPEVIVKTAVQKKLGAIAVCDHNSIKGALKAKAIKSKVDVVIGSEVRTQIGDVIGFCISEEIKSRDFLEVIDEIRAQGGLACVAHPYRGKAHFFPKLVAKADLIEVANGRSVKESNRLSECLARRLNKKITAGSDAHFAFEIGSMGVSADAGDSEELFKCIKRGKVDVFGHESPFLVHGGSVAVEKIKRFLNWQF